VARTETGDRLLALLGELDAITREVPAEEASRLLDAATLEVFWRDWPHVRTWAETVWQRLGQDLAVPAQPVDDPELDEVGGGD
jgi:hypothetical protein